MNISRERPPKDCSDLGLWLSGVVNDAMWDAREAGLDPHEAAGILISAAGFAAHAAVMTPDEIEATIKRIAL